MSKSIAVDAAPWVAFMLAIAGVVIMGLVKFVAWYARQSFADIKTSIKTLSESVDLQNQKIGAQDKAWSTLEHRLRSGTESFAKQNQTLERLNDKVERQQRDTLDLATKYLQASHYEQWVRDHNEKHREIDARIEGLERATHKLIERIDEIGDEVHSGLRKLNEMMAKHVNVPRGES